ncbi:Hypothetical_protein [Hexamita inflata]|uniref:Hypothetical_protein n=1 Tax=Hexamita inflata TaxID=28002 RepID=A0AA86UZD1_9EUKA|nr:Hypothetical protein HINF_LOCUS65895 [Hexamita inflata]
MQIMSMTRKKLLDLDSKTYCIYWFTVYQQAPFTILSASPQRAVKVINYLVNLIFTQYRPLGVFAKLELVSPVHYFGSNHAKYKIAIALVLFTYLHRVYI